MQTELPFYESPEDALRSCIQHLKGAKTVGKALWPDKTSDAAGRLLMDCVNAGRPEKLEISQIMLILTMARDAGYHTPFYWFAGQLGYEAKPVTMDEEVNRLVTAVEQAGQTLVVAAATLERIRLWQTTTAKSNPPNRINPLPCKTGGAL